MKTLFHEGHLTASALDALLAGTLDDRYLLDVAEHLANCEHCTNALALTAEQSPVNPPTGLAEHISQYVTGKERRRQNDYVRFCVQVAACAAVVIGLTTYSLLQTRTPQSITLPTPQTASLPVPETLVIPPPTKNETLWGAAGNFFKNVSQLITQQEESNLD